MLGILASQGRDYPEKMFVLSLGFATRPLLFFALVIEGFPRRAPPAAPFLSG